MEKKKYKKKNIERIPNGNGTGNTNENNAIKLINHIDDYPEKILPNRFSHLNVFFVERRHFHTQYNFVFSLQGWQGAHIDKNIFPITWMKRIAYIQKKIN